MYPGDSQRDRDQGQNHHNQNQDYHETISLETLDKSDHASEDPFNSSSENVSESGNEMSKAHKGARRMFRLSSVPNNDYGYHEDTNNHLDTGSQPLERPPAVLHESVIESTSLSSNKDPNAVDLDLFQQELVEALGEHGEGPWLAHDDGDDDDDTGKDTANNQDTATANLAPNSDSSPSKSSHLFPSTWTTPQAHRLSGFSRSNHSVNEHSPTRSDVSPTRHQHTHHLDPVTLASGARTNVSNIMRSFSTRVVDGKDNVLSEDDEDEKSEDHHLNERLPSPSNAEFLTEAASAADSTESSPLQQPASTPPFHSRTDDPGLGLGLGMGLGPGPGPKLQPQSKLRTPRFPSDIYLGDNLSAINSINDDVSSLSSNSSAHSYYPHHDHLHQYGQQHVDLDSPVGLNDSHAILHGKSLRRFGPSHPVRQKLYKLLHRPWVSPVVFILILLHVILLSYDNSHCIYPIMFSNETFETVSLFHKWGTSWLDYVFLVIFIAYTFELTAKIIVFGLWDDSDIIGRKRFSWKEFFISKLRLLSNPSGSYAMHSHNHSRRLGPDGRPQITNTFTTLMSKQGGSSRSSNTNRRSQSVERAFLRSSWNRVDFIAVVSFWISFLLNICGNVENRSQFFVFKALSCLRILRFLAITKDTSLILKGLKQSSPYLSDVSIFIGFFWVLFAFIGVQSFNSSLRRQCVWVDPEGILANYSTGQFCGSYLDPKTLEKLPYVDSDGHPARLAKGFSCPVNSVCVSGENPYSNTVSFDNIFNSLELTFVVMSANTFTDIMYDVIDTDYLASCLFFVFGILVLAFWQANLLVAVVAYEFRAARALLAESSSHKKSRSLIRSATWFLNGERSRKFLLRNKWGRAYYFLRWIWLLIILADLIMQCTVHSKSSESHIHLVYLWEIWTTAALGLEVVIRFLCYLPFLYEFFRSKSNIVDLVLTVINVIILFPFVHKRHEVYAWLSVFQIMRFYRIALAVPYVRNLWVKVVGNYRTIFSLTFFYFALTFFVSIMACQLLRGVVPMVSNEGSENIFSFFDLSSSFMSMYIITSTENWTSIVYLAIEAASNYFTAACYGAFFVIWFIFSNYVVMNIFIGVINENLEISPEVKRKEQIKSFIRQYAIALTDNTVGVGAISVLRSVLKKKKTGDKSGADTLNNPEAVAAAVAAAHENEHSHTFNLLLQRRVVQDFIDIEDEEGAVSSGNRDYGGFENIKVIGKLIKHLKRKTHSDGNPFRRSEFNFSNLGGTTNMAQNFLDIQTEVLELKRKYLEAHPTYNVSLYIFKPYNKFRNFCQKVVASSYGERIEGYNPSVAVWYGFNFVMFSATIVMVILTCMTTPIFYVDHLTEGHNWIRISDITFFVVFLVEFLLKVVADGFIATPNAYIRSIWNFVDFLVLITLFVSVVIEYESGYFVAHYIRSFQAFKALRLLSISRNAQRTFQNVIFSGFGKILGAILVSLSLLLPFSLWGLNIFRGKLYYCTDSNVFSFTDCSDEYLASPYDWNILAPRAVTKHYYDYDQFFHALLIQFEVISLEGWVDVLSSVTSITGSNSNPRTLASNYNAIFPMMYNIVGTIFILTLFISVIIRNHAESRGTAYLTDEQLSWYEIKKRLMMIKPSRAPIETVPGTWRFYIQKQYLTKNSWLSLVEGILLLLIAILLLSEFYPARNGAEETTRLIYMVFVLFYECNIVLRIWALGFRVFLQSYWNIYAFVVVTVAFVLTLAGSVNTVADFYYNFQKLSMVGMMLLVIPKSSRLKLLFDAATASLLEVGNLLVTWFVLFLVFAIAFNQVFGLTRIGGNSTSTRNFRTIPKALIVLFRMSCGEGWNQILDDYMVSPPYCVLSDEFSTTDCGNKTAAMTLFICWNVLSMYIFVNLFVSLIYENFSYILHRSAINITNEDIENFRNTWAKFDPTGSGYILKSDLPKLLRETEGYFSMKIYDGKFTVPEILNSTMIRGSNPFDVDITAMNDVLRNMPTEYYKKQRRTYDMFCEHVLSQAHAEKGISFHKLILQFPMYKDLNPNKCLTLVDYLDSRMLLQKVNTELLKKRLIGFLEMIYQSRKLTESRNKNAAVDAKRLSIFSQDGLKVIPKIDITQVVEDLENEPEAIDLLGFHRGESSIGEFVADTESRGRTSGASPALTIKSTSPRRKRTD